MRSVLLSLALFFTLVSAVPSYAADNKKSASTAEQSFVKKRYTIKGEWSVGEQDGKTVIHFNDAFKTKSGPDLKVVLHTETVDNVDPKTAIEDGVKIGVLKSNRGAQSYILPDDITLSDFKSVLIHCEAFSVLWGGFDIVDAASAP
ncbi:DM13 domain-containing protein [Fretibacter rubidus]|uniref:DM13 domain-containing protein n=1 Tax=Fretibacter rubidus TaxID=570162 RepID=UPI00352A8D32